MSDAKAKVTELFDLGLEEEGDEAARAFADGLALARTFYPTDTDALADDLDLTHWRMNLAITLQGLERWEQMRDVTQELLAQFPDAAARTAAYERMEDEPQFAEHDALCSYAIAQQHCGDLPGALVAIDLALTRAPEDADCHHEKACILHLMGDTAGALQSMRASIDADGDDRRQALREDADFADLVGTPDFDADDGHQEEARAQARLTDCEGRSRPCCDMPARPTSVGQL